MKRLLLALPLIVACDKPSPGTSSSTDATPSAAPSLASAAPSVTASAAPAEAPTTVAAQHVLVAYAGAKDAPKGVKRTKAEAKARAEEVATKAKGGADFTELVKTYSDDPGSKDRLGSVGKFTRDKMVKPFSDAAFALKVDETSGVVETPFGFHVIKRNQ
jgi:parvulin-like peptidyl-prolyl isomerase